MANATRESVSRNALTISKESCSRYASHKELCTKFVRKFEDRTTAERDPKFGFHKYMAQLRLAANRHIETVTFDLDDLASFCRQELQDPAAAPDGMSKLQQQQTIEQMVADIEQNVLRYQKYFFDACASEIPERDDGFNQANADVVKDTVRKWRDRQLALQQEERGGNAPAVSQPVLLKNSFDIRFKPRSDKKSVHLREINARHVGALVQLDCLVTRVSEVKPKIEVATFTCDICGAEIFMNVEGERYTPPKECPSQRCKDNKQSGKLRFHVRSSKFARYQEMRVQEMAEHVPTGGVPMGINVVMGADLTRKVLPGDAITLTGAFLPYQLPWFLARKMGTQQEMHIEAHHIDKHKQGYKESAEDERAVVLKLDEEHRKGGMYERAAKSIAPEIFGLLDVKKALLLGLIGSFTKQMKDGMKIRGDIHCLFMGDPGVAKSQLLKQAVNIAPRSVYTTGKGTSGVGLTASVVRDKQTGEVTLEGGALVLADTGVCCIDEFDKMEEGDRTAIHEVMEQQSVSIAKSGITTTLNCRTTILAGANPVYGRYDPRKSPVENIDLPPALLSRFDLLFLLLDTVDMDKDKMLAHHVCKVHTNYGQKKEGLENAASSSQVEDVLNLGFKAFDANFMRSYIRRAKTFEPMIADDLQKDIVDAYVTMREEEKKGDVDSRKSYTTPRTLLAILRLSQAHARTRFSDTVEKADFEEAMRLMRASKESVELSSPAQKGQHPLEVVYDIISNLARTAAESDGGWVDVQSIMSIASHKVLSREQVLEAVEHWEGLSVLVQNPEKTKVMFVVPPA